MIVIINRREKETQSVVPLNIIKQRKAAQIEEQPFLCFYAKGINLYAE